MRPADPKETPRAPRRWWLEPVSPAVAACAIALWLGTVGNLALWLRLAQVLDPSARAAATAAALAVVVVAVHCALFALLAVVVPGRWVKPVWMALVVAAALAQHYMLRFGVVVDPQLIASVAQTNVTEAMDVLTWRLAFDLLWLAGPPIAWLANVPFRPQRWTRRTLGAAAVAVAGLAVGVGATAASFRTFAPLVRNHMALRYMPNPVMPTVSAVRLARKSLRGQTAPPAITLGEGATLGASHAVAGAKPPLLLLVVGETARGDHFGLNGYPRDTTPGLAARGAVSHPSVRSCGSQTLVSLPCMFSPVGAKTFDRGAPSNGNLLDVVSAAGMAVLWVDNQSGCKGVCDRVVSASTEDLAGSAAAARLCRDGECLDDALLERLDARIAALPPAQRARGVLVVLHQMGSHGPAYGRRSPPEAKRFLPECATLDLAECDPAQLVNAYDNSIAYTDAVLSRAIDLLASWSDRYATGLLYLSDHGESLGEKGVFLHGLPVAIAPAAQMHVPLVTWSDPAFLARTRVDGGCLARARTAAASHDNLFHSVLGMLDVVSPTYRAELDLWSPCRGAVVASTAGEATR